MGSKINATELDYIQLGNLIDDCTEILKGCNIKVVKNCHYDFHTSKAFGYALKEKGENTITINYYFFKASLKNNHMYELRNTMIHEMLHVIANQIDIRAGHRGMWLHLASIVNNNTEYKITRLATAEKAIIKNLEHPAKHTIVCQKCGMKYYYHRDCKAVTEVKSNSPFYQCNICSGKLKYME